MKRRSWMWWGVVVVVSVVRTAPSPAQERGGPHLEIPQLLERGDSGKVLLLLPCAGCGAASWSRFMEVNEDRFRMFAVTFPGYAGSPRPELPLWTGETVFQDNLIAQLSKLIDERGLTDVAAVGQSFGSLMALSIAVARPDVITAVVNVDGSSVNPVSRERESAEERLANARRIVDDDWALRLQDPEQYRRFNGATRQPDEAQRKLHHGMFMASDRVSMLHYWRENVLRDRNPDFVGLGVPYLDIKAIYPWSTNPDSTLASHRKRLAEVGTPSQFRQVVFHETSHWIHLERPRVLGTVIRDFIDGREVHDVGPYRMGHVEVVGSGTRDVILMPCLGCDWHAWDRFMERNSERYRMVAVSWPGMGDTDLPRVVADPHGTPYFDYLMDALRRLIDREELDRPVIVGHSAAAVAAVRFAAEYPDLVSGVVNVDAIVANLDTYGYTRAQRIAWADGEMVDVLRQYDSDGAWRDLNSPPSLVDAERAAFYSRMWLTPPRHNVFAYWRDWLRTDAGTLLPKLRVPFLAIHALNADPERAAAKREDLETRYRMAPVPPGSRVVYIADSGHSIWEYRPEEFDEVLAGFVLGSATVTVRGR